jgi:hypothetical protein
MDYRKIFKISFLRVIVFLFIGLILDYGHSYCRPFVIKAGALLSDGSVGGGVIYSCGNFSKWLWQNPEVFNFYNSISSWHILAFIIFLWIVSNFIIEAIVSRKKVK